MKHIIFTSPKHTAFEQTERSWARKLLGDVLFVSEFSLTDLEANEDYIAVENNFTILEKISHLIFFGAELLGIFLSDLKSEYSNKAYVKRWRHAFSVLLKVSMQVEAIKGVLKENREKPAYTMWANDYALLLAIAKKRGYINKCYSRAHGRDVIEHREPTTGKLPFQAIKYQYLDGVYCVSRFTQYYIQNRYPKFVDKVHVSYLGTEDRGIGPLLSKIDEFVIVSIGRVRNVKRFYLIAEMLTHASRQIRWVHFGDISESDPTTARYLTTLDSLSANTNVSIEHHGYTPNDAILDYFSAHYIDCLINTSENEGLPVSIQEAISFGIPCMATDVGGTSDIVKSETGLLIQKDFNIELTMKKLENFIETKCRDQTFRQGTRSFWQAHFDASQNYPKFFKEISTSRSL